jgi:hypothetical protein
MTRYARSTVFRQTRRAKELHEVISKNSRLIASGYAGMRDQHPSELPATAFRAIPTSIADFPVAAGTAL